MNDLSKLAHLYRAVLEGVAYAFRGMLEIVAASGTQIEKITLTDGGAQSVLWRQIFADVLGRPISWQPRSGGTALGAAITGALACGALSEPAAIKNWFEPTVDIYPDTSMTAVYDHNFQVFQELYPRTRDLFE